MTSSKSGGRPTANAASPSRWPTGPTRWKSPCAVGCREGDEVITAANAGGYATAACRILGAVPVYADIDRSLTISPASVAEALGPRTKAVVVTHLYGKMADVEGVRGRLAGRDIPILEDCAQSHGAMRCGRRAGSLGALAAFSFYPTRTSAPWATAGPSSPTTPSTPGAPNAPPIWLGREVPRRAARAGATAGWTNSRPPSCGESSRTWMLGTNGDAPIVGQYREAAAGTGLHLPHVPGPDFVAHLCVARHARRDEVRRRLEERGIATAIHYPTPDHRQPAMAGQAVAHGGPCRDRSGPGRDTHTPLLPGNDPKRDRLCV